MVNMFLVPVGSVSFRDIGTFWDIKLCMKTWYNSKIYINFVDFSCVSFLAQNVSISPDQNFSRPLHQNVLVLLLNNI